MFAHSGVRTTPGETMLTRMGASSTASARVSPSIAAQMLAPSDQPACGRCPAIPEVKTIEPPLRILPLPYLGVVGAPITQREEAARRIHVRSCQAAELQCLAGCE